MFELFGLIFGGVSRLAQHWLDLRDKQAERDQEYRLMEQQARLAEMKYTAEADLRRMDMQAAESEADAKLLIEAINAQKEEAKAAGGRVLALSASVRPVLSYWFVFLYSCAKAAQLYIAIDGGMEPVMAVRAAYTEFDGTILASIVAFYFADRSLRKRV